MRRTLFWAGLFSISIVIVAALYLESRSKDNRAIRIGLNEWPGYAPLVYAETLDLYRKYDLNVDLVYLKNPTDGVERFKAGEIDGLAIVVADLLMLLSGGYPIQGVLLTDYSGSGDSILSKTPIREPRDMVGKTLGIDSLNSFSHAFVIAWLEKNGLTERDVQFKVVPFDQMVEKIKLGEIFAGHTWEPEIQRARSDGLVIIGSASDVPGFVLETVGLHRKLIDSKPEFVKKFVNVFYLAQKEMLKDPTKSAKEMQRFFKNDPEAFAASFSTIHHIDYSESRQMLALDGEGSVRPLVKKVNQFFLERGQVNSASLYRDALTGEFFQ